MTTKPAPKPTHDELEARACTPAPIRADGFNPAAVLPYGVQVVHIQAAMNEWADFLGFVNTQLHSRSLPRFETMMMPAGFSSLVGEFAVSNIPKHCPTICKNGHHNGHPDLIPPGIYPKDDVLHGHDGIEVKASRYFSSWQGHNKEEIFLMVFVFASSRPTDTAKGIEPQPFRFIKVVGAQLEEDDWKLAGRNEGSRRTITASVLPTGYAKMEANWIYRDPDLSPALPALDMALGLGLELAEEEQDS